VIRWIPKATSLKHGGLNTHPSSKISCIYQRAWTKVNVHSNLLDSVARRRAHCALACLLLLTISYGAIVEAAHSHGSPASRSSQLTLVSDGSDSQSSYQSHANHSDCSLCQFQRHLFGGLAQVILIALTPQQIPFLFNEAVSYLSTSALPTFGRAPPLF
jgi:disulfide bond formation protein DsbB